MLWRDTIRFKFAETSKTVTQRCKHWSRTCSYLSKRERPRKKNITIPVVLSTKLADRKDIAGSGHQTALAQEAQRRQPSLKLEVSNRTGRSTSGRDDRPLCYSYKKGVAWKTKIAMTGTFQLCVSLRRGQCREGVTCLFVHLSKDERAPSPNRTPKGHTIKDSNTIAKPRVENGEIKYPC